MSDLYQRGKGYDVWSGAVGGSQKTKNNQLWCGKKKLGNLFFPLTFWKKCMLKKLPGRLKEGEKRCSWFFQLAKKSRYFFGKPRLSEKYLVAREGKNVFQCGFYDPRTFFSKICPRGSLAPSLLWRFERRNLTSPSKSPHEGGFWRVAVATVAMLELKLSCSHVSLSPRIANLL